MHRLAPLPLALALACSPATEEGPADDSGGDVVDLTRAFPDPPADLGGEMLIFEPPLYVIEPYEETQYCWFGTYEGDEVGIFYNGMHQAPMGHHVIMLTHNADPIDYPDGSVIDCTDEESLPMTELEPNFTGAGGLEESEDGPSGSYTLPEGMGAVLKPGTRYVIQSHYVNYTGDRVRVNDRMVYGVKPSDEIEVWTAPFAHVQTDMPIPPGQDHSLSFECAWEDDYNVLFLGGHMHEFGTRFSTEHLSADGEAHTLYDIPTWDPLYRDAPPFDVYLDAPYQVRAGESFRTNCAWFNTTDEVLDFPAEMCVTFGMVYPARVAVTCDASSR